MTVCQDRSPPEQPAAETPADTGQPRTIRSTELLQGHSEVWIQHGQEMYRLRLTGTGKLYLTK